MFLADIVDPLTEQDPALRDSADQPVLGTLKASQAHYLVRGDKDLLVLSISDRHADGILAEVPWLAFRPSWSAEQLRIRLHPVAG